MSTMIYWLNTTNITLIILDLTFLRVNKNRPVCFTHLKCLKSPFNQGTFLNEKSVPLEYLYDEEFFTSDMEIGGEKEYLTWMLKQWKECEEWFKNLQSKLWATVFY